MTETINTILTSQSAPLVLIILIFGIVVLVILAKSGYLSINTKSSKLNVSIGGADKEREIIRHQVEWVRHHLEGLEAKMDKPVDYNEWLGKYVVERVYDEYINVITFNHISTADTYIEVKQDLILDVVRKYTTKDFFKTKKFEEMIRQDTKECIETLVQIRELYK